MDKAVLTYADGTKVVALENNSLNTNKIIPLAMPFAGKLDHESGWETDYLTEHPGRYIFFALISPCEDRVEDAFVYDREYQEFIYTDSEYSKLSIQASMDYIKSFLCSGKKDIRSCDVYWYVRGFLEDPSTGHSDDVIKERDEYMKKHHDPDRELILVEDEPETEK